MTNKTADALHDVFISPSEADGDFDNANANVVDGLFAIARGLHAIARSITVLGNADASSPMGALENLSMELKNGLLLIASSMESVSASIDAMGMDSS